MDFETPKNRTERKPSVLYHASSNRNIEVLEVRGERTRDVNEKPSIFATPNKALASVFLVPTDDSWTHSGLVNDIPFIVISNKERFLELDNGGSIYSVSSDTFETDPNKGLRENEWTSTDGVVVENNEVVDSALNTMLRLGVQVYFVDTETFDKFNSAEDNGESILQSLKPEPYPDFDQPAMLEEGSVVLDNDFYIKYFLPEDQKRMHSQTWDHTDEDAQLNKWRRELDKIDENTLNAEQIKNRRDALWMWYHHASQFAHKTGDIERAIRYIDKAMDYRETGGPITPNQITPLLKMLYESKYDEARVFIDTEIPNAISDHNGTEYTNERPNVEKDTANHLLSYFIEHYPVPG